MRDRRMRQRGWAAVVAVLVTFAAAPAMRAAPITYLISGVGSGTVNGTPFANAAYVIRGVGDTASVTIISGFPFPGSAAMAPVSATIEIAGAGTATFAGAATLTNVSPDATLSFAVGSLAPMLRGADLGLLGYDMRSAFGPLALGPPFLSQAAQPSDLGPIILDSSSAVTFEAVTPCGNGVLDAGEACDDGNTSGADCCAPNCQLADAGTTCRAAAGACDAAEVCTGTSAECPADGAREDGALCSTGDPCAANGSCLAGTCVAGPPDCDDHVPCTQDVCDEILGCVHLDAPATGCLTAPKATVMLASSATPGEAMFGWRWANGPALAVADLADPTLDASYELCVYGGASSARIADAVLPAGARWAAAGARGYRYREPTSATVARLRSGVAGKSSALVKSRGLVLRQALPSTAPITVQLRRSGAAFCLESRFDALQRSDAAKLKGRLP